MDLVTIMDEDEPIEYTLPNVCELSLSTARAFFNELPKHTPVHESDRMQM